LIRNTGSTPIRKPALKTTVLYSRLAPNAGVRDTLYLTEVTSSVTGSVLREPLKRQWCDGIESLNELCERAYETTPPGLATAYFVNNEISQQQSGKDTWPAGVPNVMVCKPNATDADRARAVVENVGNLIVRMLEEFSEKDLLGEKFPAEIDIAGGGSELDYLMQYVADVSGHTLRRLEAKEAGARGAALAAMVSVRGKGEFKEYNSEAPERCFVCERPDRRKRYLMWQRLEHDVLRNTLPVHAEIEA
jgi:sugar (pentulose or hexulose) kinase